MSAGDDPARKRLRAAERDLFSPEAGRMADVAEALFRLERRSLVDIWKAAGVKGRTAAGAMSGSRGSSLVRVWLPMLAVVERGLICDGGTSAKDLTPLRALPGEDPADLAARVGLAVRARRQALGLDQHELGVDRTRVSDVERGDPLTLRLLREIAPALRWTVRLSPHPRPHPQSRLSQERDRRAAGLPPRQKRRR